MKKQGSLKTLFAVSLLASLWLAGTASAIEWKGDSGRAAQVQPVQPTAARTDSAPRKRPGVVLGAEDPPPAVWEPGRSDQPDYQSSDSSSPSYESSGDSY